MTQATQGLNRPSPATSAETVLLQDNLAQVDGILGVIAKTNGIDLEDQANALWAVRRLLDECRDIARRLPSSSMESSHE